MNLIIGLLTGLLVLAAYSRLESARVSLIGRSKFLFLAFVAGCALLLSPAYSPFLWAALTPLFYCVLDDIKTKTLNIYLPILTTLLFLPFLESPYFFIYSLVPFFIFLFFCRKTDGRFIGEGDIYLFLPLSLLPCLGVPSASWLTVLELWVRGLLFASLLAAVVMLPQRLVGRAPHAFAFGPFLVLGFITIHSDWPFTPYLLFVLIALSALLYACWGCQVLWRWLNMRK